MRHKPSGPRLQLPHNSLHVPAGQVPHFGSGSEQELMQRAIAMEMQAITREIYVRAAAEAMRNCGPAAGWPEDQHFREIAVTSRSAARNFFIGLGVIEPTDGEATDD